MPSIQVPLAATLPKPSIMPTYPVGTSLPTMVKPSTTGIAPATSTVNSDTASATASSTTTATSTHDPIHISIMSMNLLAPAYVRPIDKRTGQIQPFAAFEWIQDSSFLDWDHRQSKIVDILSHSQASVICLQELQVERDVTSSHLGLPQWLTDFVAHHGYDAFLPPQAELESLAQRNVRVLDADVAVTCAVLVQQLACGWKPVRGLPGDTTTAVSVCLEYCASRGEDANDGDAAAVTVDPIIVSSVHLDATNEKKRVSQLMKCLGRSRILLDAASATDATSTANGANTANVTTNGTAAHPPHAKKSLTCIMAGDMNAEFMPGSCIEAVLVDRQFQHRTDEQLHEQCAAALRLKSKAPPTPGQLKDWKKVRNEAITSTRDLCVSMQRVPTQGTRSGHEHFDEDCDDEQSKPDANGNDNGGTMEQMDTDSAKPPTKKTPSMMQWKLDHMLYTQDRLKPLGRWSTLEEEDVARRFGLPTATIPSDHMPIASVFEVVPSVQLDPDKRERLIATMEQLAQQHKGENKAMEDAIDKQIDVIEAALGGELAEATQPNQRKRKKRNSKPPEEVMELMRQKRTRKRELKAQHKEARAAFVAELSNQERLVVQETFNISASTWAGRGA